MYIKLFARPFIGFALAVYLSYWLGHDAQPTVSVFLKPVMESVAQGVAYFSAAVLALSTFGFIHSGYRLWRWHNGKGEYCGRCGAMMEIRNGRYGAFWGCMNYPRCHGSEEI